MAKDRGWWNLDLNTEIDDADREHIAKCIIEGYTCGEIVGREDESEVEHGRAKQRKGKRL